jgi:dipeptidyl aminopeptidase/acylaminoacyl peptidase
MRWWTGVWAALCAAVVVPWAQAQVQTQAQVQAPAAPADLVPVEAFFSPAQFRGASLSPSGRWLGSLTSQPGKRIGLLILDLHGKEGSRFIGAGDKDDMIWFRWVSDDWLVFRLDDPNDRSASGYGSGLVSTSRDGKTSRMLIARRWDAGDPFRRRNSLEPNHHYASLGKPGSNEVVVLESHWDQRYQYSHSTVKVLDVSNGNVRSLSDGLPTADSWWFDAQGRPRVASRDAAGITTTWWADAKTGVWREIAKAPAFEQSFVPQYVQGEDVLMVSTSGAGGQLELRRFDFDKGQPAETPLLATPGFGGDVAPFRLRGSGEVLGVQLPLDAETPAWFSPAMAQWQNEVDTRFPGRANHIVGCVPCDSTASVVLVNSYTDTDPGFVALYRPPEKKWQLVGAAKQDIDPARMARLELHRTPARDGLELPVWITRPQALLASGKPGPAVVLVHGGPNVRGTSWRWNAEAQFLASRGYVVIEPEFRGSDGYGSKHLRAGFKQWGLTMQDDVTDAVRFAVQRGWVDASRVCIMGASYGGYAALWGVAKDPDVYRCAVAFAAVSDPRFMFDFHWNDISDEGKSYSLAVTLGDRKADDARLAAVAPVQHASRIKAPVLLAHGAADRRVPVQNGERMRDALLALGKPVEWVLYKDEFHSLYYLANEVDYYRRVETFLKKHLQP